MGSWVRAPKRPNTRTHKAPRHQMGEWVGSKQQWSSRAIETESQRDRDIPFSQYQPRCLDPRRCSRHHQTTPALLDREWKSSACACRRQRAPGKAHTCHARNSLHDGRIPDTFLAGPSSPASPAGRLPGRCMRALADTRQVGCEKFKYTLFKKERDSEIVM